MKELKATVATEKGSRYLQTLCKHWGHKFTVDFTPENGTIDMEHSQISLYADTGNLSIVLKTDEERQEKMKAIIEVHINRFAHKETLDYKWS